MGLLSAITNRFRPTPTEVIEGYENPELIDVVFRKTVAYHDTQAVDPNLAKARTVLDFGGACGLHYKQTNSQSVRWAVVETPAMVARASALSTDKLRFFTDIRQACTWLGAIDVMHSNGALQYTPSPEETLRELCAVGAQIMIWKRMRLSDRRIVDMQTSRLIDNGHGIINGIKDKLVRYREITIPESTFLACHEGYELIERGKNNFLFHKP